MKTLMSAIVLTLVVIAPTYAQAVDGDWFGVAASSFDWRSI